jgi:hypothetical protein
LKLEAWQAVLVASVASRFKAAKLKERKHLKGSEKILGWEQQWQRFQADTLERVVFLQSEGYYLSRG